MQQGALRLLGKRLGGSRLASKKNFLRPTYRFSGNFYFYKRLYAKMERPCVVHSSIVMVTDALYTTLQHPLSYVTSAPVSECSSANAIASKFWLRLWEETGGYCSALGKEKKLPPTFTTDHPHACRRISVQPPHAYMPSPAATTTAVVHLAQLILVAAVGTEVRG